jgi:hypothetical protein
MRDLKSGFRAEGDTDRNKTNSDHSDSVREKTSDPTITTTRSLMTPKPCMDTWVYEFEDIYPVSAQLARQ